MTIIEARQTIVELVNELNTDLTSRERIALAMADMALKSIDEMDAMLSALDEKGETDHDTQR